MRPLIGCLQRRRHQPGRAGCWDREQDPRRRTDGGADRGRAGKMETRWVREVVWQRNAKAERWGSWRRSPDERRDSSLLEIVAWLTKFT